MEINATQLILEESKKLKKTLGITEEDFHKMQKYEDERCFDWWVYSILDDILRFCLKVIKESEILEATDKLEKDTIYTIEAREGLDLQRLIYEGIDFEFEMIKRKLSEHLLLVIFLSRENQKDLTQLAQIYFLLSEINDGITKRKDFERYYAIRNDGHDFFLNDLIGKLNEKLGDINNKPFFLKPNKVTLDSSAGKLFCSFADLYEKVLLSCDKKDAIVLGKSYRQYHELSKPMHAHGHARSPLITVEDILVNITHIEMLCIRILGYTINLQT